jgi:hypothetical protein
MKLAAYGQGGRVFCCNSDVLMMSYQRSDSDKMRCLEDAYRSLMQPNRSNTSQAAMQ